MEESEKPQEAAGKLRSFRERMGGKPSGPSPYWLTRFVFLRLLGLLYFVAFLILVHQAIPLIGEHGLLPARLFLDRVEARFDTRGQAFAALPSLFWLRVSDGFLLGMAWVGAGLSFLVLAGFANSVLMGLLWFLYMSFVHIGQTWYGYGWEIQLLETGFLAIFICPLFDPRPFPRCPPPAPVVWLLRWLTFRIMFGAGLIKIRGDSCWRDLTCLFYHFETQPIPNPLSSWFHDLPKWMLKFGVLFNHLAELVAPFAAFGPRLARHVAGGIFVLFQFMLILSGNLSFLNWLTLCAIVACFDDTLLRRLLPRRLVERAGRAAENAHAPRGQTIAVWTLVAVVAWLSIAPVRNLFSSGQIMNTSFNQLNLVNTYGAFGAVGRTRPEIILEGTGEAVITPRTVWRAYEFKAKPGDPYRIPPIIAPYHYRVDWQIWFAAMSIPERQPWLINMIWKFLHNDEGALSLIANNPFPDSPPRFIRAELYRYEFAEPGDASGAVWKRTRLGAWLPPVSLDNVNLRRYIAAQGWND